MQWMGALALTVMGQGWTVMNGRHPFPFTVAAESRPCSWGSKEMPILWLGRVVETSCGRAAPVLVLFRVGRGLGGHMGKSEDARAERKRGGRGLAADQHPG